MSLRRSKRHSRSEWTQRSQFFQTCRSQVEIQAPSHSSPPPCRGMFVTDCCVCCCVCCYRLVEVRRWNVQTSPFTCTELHSPAQRGANCSEVTRERCRLSAEIQFVLSGSAVADPRGSCRVDLQSGLFGISRIRYFPFLPGRFELKKGMPVDVADASKMDFWQCFRGAGCDAQRMWNPSLS